MSISGALSNALSGLATTSRMADIVSSNLSNALTDGYGRRQAELASSQLGGAGGGVRIEGITRFVDAGLLADRRLADAALTGQERGASTLNRLEQSIGGPEDAANLGMRLAAFERALISAASDPASETRLASAVTRLGDVAETLRENTRAVQTLRQEADASIARDIDVLNTALLQVEGLNRDIVRLNATGTDTSSLVDARQRVIDQIAEIVPVREMTRDNGTVGLLTTSGTTLLDSKAAQFSFDQTPTITADMTFASGALSGIMIDGEPISPTNGIGRLDGGSLGAAFSMRDATLVETQVGLDEIAADLVARFQDPANDSTIIAGDPGLLTDEGGALDLADLDGLAGRISLNAAIDPFQGGNATLIRDGLGAVAAGPTGDPGQLNNWIAALGAARADTPNSASRSAAGRMADFTAQVGSTRLRAEEQLSFTTARWDTLREAELANGVDTDVELQNLLRIEQAYAANAKVIQTVDFMMQRLMEL
ncbi:flagellar hook-associated protein FlgK [Yoonia sp. SS1-5]|uniref:Flagellar hook-associated protein 1 n=1 Tax=Yoonia rhodophyticola TaxID=3137370 RepID=A0AAN0MAL8_9RHOB